MEVFHKVGSSAAIATEIASLRWLSVPGGAAVAKLHNHGSTWLTTVLMDPALPNRRDAAEFGRRLAFTHAAGAGGGDKPRLSSTQLT